MSAILQSHRVTGVAVDRDAREKDDFYPTPPEGTEALLRVETFDGPIWEPACGDGAMSKVLEAAGYSVVSTDLLDRGFGQSRVDFLMEQRALAPNIVTNPPFKMVSPFIRQALRLSTRKVAMLLRLACLEGNERGEIYETTPLARVWVFKRRLQFKRPGWEDTGAGGMLPFAWYVWDHAHTASQNWGGSDALPLRLPPQVHPLARMMRLVILESPYAGDINHNVAYARACVRDSLLRGEAPMASHLLYTQEGILCDEIPDERQLGIDAGLAWGRAAIATVVYTDLGISRGMKLGIAAATDEGRAVEFRELGGIWMFKS